MSLADKLAATRAAAEARIPPDRQAIMERATEDLRRSGILDRIVPVGRTLDFSLEWDGYNLVHTLSRLVAVY